MNPLFIVGTVMLALAAVGALWMHYRDQGNVSEQREQSLRAQLVSVRTELTAVSSRAVDAAADAASEHERADTLRALADEWQSKYEEATRSTELTAEEVVALHQGRCMHCGGSHIRACPRVRRIRFRTDGQTVLEVEFWEDGMWPKEQVVWLEDHALPIT